MCNHVFSDQEEFLYLLNLIKSKKVKNFWPHLGEQGWLNEVYLWEKFDIGQEYNTCPSMLKKQQLLQLMHNATIIHFAGPFKPDNNCHKNWKTLCDKWNHYRQMLSWDKS